MKQVMQIHCEINTVKCLEARKFEIDQNWKCKWPLCLVDICKFTSWALQVKGLQPNTVKSYLSSIKIIHELANEKYHTSLLKYYDCPAMYGK